MLLICIFHLTSIENGAQCIFSCWHGRCFAGNTWHWPMPKEQIENWVSNVRKRIAISLKRIYHFARKSRDFWFGSITICRSWIHIQFKAIIKRILSQNAAYIWLISSCACFILTQCNAMPIDIWQAFQYLQVFRFQCECQRVDRFTFDCIASSLCHSIVLSLLPLRKLTKSPHKLSLVQCTTNANT